MTHCQIKNACGLATLRPGLGNRTRLFMSLTPGLDAVRRQQTDYNSGYPS